MPEGGEGNEDNDLGVSWGTRPGRLELTSAIRESALGSEARIIFRSERCSNVSCSAHFLVPASSSLPFPSPAALLNWL